SAEKDKDADLNVIDVDNLNSRESPAEETPAEPKKKSLKGKEISSSNSDFDKEQHVITSSGTSLIKSIRGMKIPLNVPSATMDNVYFHHENSVSRSENLCYEKLVF
ncbi:hypothetical protein L195_g059827, partial [Trifolium pratense]